MTVAGLIPPKPAQTEYKPWFPVMCKGRLKDGRQCPRIVAMKSPDYVKGTIEVVCKCKARTVV